MLRNNVLLAKGEITSECIEIPNNESNFKYCRRIHWLTKSESEIPKAIRYELALLTLYEIRDSVLLKKLNDVFEQTELLHPYDGDMPYVFISYAHKDSFYVMPVIAALQKAECPVWYDAGIQVGSEWPESIAKKIINCSLVIAFISSNYVESNNCRQEITYALKNKKEILTIRLNNCEMTPGMEMQLGLSQTLNAYLHETQDEYIKQLIESPFISKLRATH